MREYLAKHSHAFEPDTVAVLAEALDEAWSQVQANSALFNDPVASRNKLAKLIVDAAMQGERDKPRLVAGAVMRFKLPRAKD